MGSSEENRRSSTSGGWEVEQEIPQCVTIMLTRYRLNPTDPTVNPTVNPPSNACQQVLRAKHLLTMSV